MATVGQQLLQPEADWKRYDDTHPLIKYKNFSFYSAVGAYQGAISYNSNGSTTDSSIEFVFYGTKLRVITPQSSTRTTSATITIDGEVNTFSINKTIETHSVLSFEILNLDKGFHKVVIDNFVLRDSKYSTFGLDAIDIDADGELIRHDYFENTHLDEPMRKYGIAHFGFDEASGNVYDKLGSNYVGTVTGATRVEGWNGEGKALSFDGVDDYLYFPYTLIPNGEKTLRFKLKAKNKGSVQYLFGNYETVGSNRGWYITILADGRLDFTFYNGSANSFVINSTESIVDGKWHDICFMWSNKVGGKSLLFVDDMKTPVVSLITALEVSYTTTTTVGKPPTENKYYLNGQIDDLQIYSKALTPADFPQKRLVIKTTDNKNLVYSTESSRVKEIPSVEEADLVNQGYAWREIDDAVDRAIDLTQQTMEYEQVSKTQMALGSGKMFTIPLKEFKTIKIENNE